MIKSFKTIEQKRVASISNKLARANFKMSARGLKMLINLISLVNPEDLDMPVNKFHVTDLWKLTDSEKSRNSLKELRSIFVDITKSAAILDKDSAEAISFIDTYRNKEEPDIFIVRFTNAIKEHCLVVEHKKDDVGCSKKDITPYVKIDMGIFNKLKTYYSMRLYIFLKSYLSIGGTGRTMREDFKFLFGLKNDIKELRIFKRDVINKAIKEINDKTDINVDIENVVIGRKVEGYKFVVKSKKIKEKRKESEDADNNEGQNANDVTKDSDQLSEVDRFLLTVNQMFGVSSDETTKLLIRFNMNMTEVFKYLSSEFNKGSLKKINTK
ncbi:replication initiation protein [Clostridium perfringens]|uniref:replication initiation protein n=1 Tax=Clostridium perfringens TaxID=1502 RepID=UPI002245F453|nr:replication initiation protein [Clostridium perfringens]EJT5920842.1 replication initiation protein [Clostridium perfringens]MCX0403347.1 replication initiation protein [Clostridium perfringens]MDM0947484.1 replication initiation protein [Clostridium perfringens]